MKAKLKSHQMPEQVVFWKWISPKMLGMVTQTSVYNWSIEGDSEPVKMFDRTANLSNNKIIHYKCDPSDKWLALWTSDIPGDEEDQNLEITKCGAGDNSRVCCGKITSTKFPTEL